MTIWISFWHIQSHSNILSKDNFNGHASFSVSQFNVSQNGDFKCFRQPYYICKKKQQHARLLASVFYFKLVFGPSARLNTNTTIQQVKVELECNDSQPVSCISSCYRNRLARLGTRCFPPKKWECSNA